MKYAFIEDYREKFSLYVLCTVLKISKSGYFGWRRRETSTRATARLKLLRAIEDIHRASRRSYGSPRIWDQLRALGFHCSKSTVERLMREHGIRAKMKRKYKATTDSKHALPVAPNLVARNFSPPAPHKLWLADITYIWTMEGWLYLAVVLDAYSRKVVGWSMNERMTKELALNALDMAYQRQKPGRGLVHHSDRGSQYASHSYQKRLWSYGMICSMSRKGNCWDNAPAESFFHTLKTEQVYFEQFKTRREATESIFEWIEVFYNRQRIHSFLAYSTPEDYEQQYAISA